MFLRAAAALGVKDVAGGAAPAPGVALAVAVEKKRGMIGIIDRENGSLAVRGTFCANARREGAGMVLRCCSSEIRQ